MSRIVISCMILVICVYGSIAFTITKDDVVDLAEQGLSVVGKRYKRKSLGIEIVFAYCAHVGSTCLVHRNEADKPTRVTIKPCCDYLVCVGVGPTEKRNALEEAVRSSDLESSGICSLSLDNNRPVKDREKYFKYVKGL